jgi:hypothetical protein
MQSESLMRCAHHPCRCLVETEDEFCSPVRRRAQHSPDESCSCNHPECQEKQEVPRRENLARPESADLFEKRAS